MTQPNHEYVVAELGRLGVPKGARVLDYGCGAGEVVQRAVAAGYDAHGVDVFYDGGSYRSDADNTGLLGKRILEIEDGRIPHADSAFHAVVSNQVLEHVADLDAVLSEVGRVLASGGVLLALFPSRDVWREGHVGVPYLHRLPRGSKLRAWYAFILRVMGMGYNKGDKPCRQWADDAVAWVDAYTYYRPWTEIEAVLRSRVGPIERREPEYLMFRLADRTVLRRVSKAMNASRVGRRVLRRFVERYAGLVLLVRKSSQ